MSSDSHCTCSLRTAPALGLAGALGGFSACAGESMARVRPEAQTCCAFIQFLFAHPVVGRDQSGECSELCHLGGDRWTPRTLLWTGDPLGSVVAIRD